jgi:integrase
MLAAAARCRIPGCAITGGRPAGEAGRPELVLHDLRRSGVRNLERLGVPRSVIKKISGHRSDSVFERYDIGDAEDRTEALEKVEAFYQGHGQTADSRGAVVPLEGREVR